MRKLILLLIVGSNTFAQDTELTNYKSGINLVWGVGDGSDKGTAYAEEYLYHNSAIMADKVVYIRSTTTITASHNARNIAGSPTTEEYVSVGTSQGVVKYKPDGDQRWSLYPQNWTAYSAPFTFASLNYSLFGDAGVSVVGSTGSNGVALNTANKTAHYHRGILDSVGDEWHTLSVADDDAGYAYSVEVQCSDGKIFYFVVNPKTPAATWRVTGTGQFYTTPAKKYFIPKIYDQTTVIVPGVAGTVTCELRNIYGNPISYRINSGATIDVGTASITLTDSSFSTGTNTLEYWYTATPSVVRTRTVVKNPAYPSASETHGDRFWVSAAQWTSETRPRLVGNSDLLFWVNQYRTNAGRNQHLILESSAGLGQRDIIVRSESAAMNALIARVDGMSATRSGAPRTYAAYAKRAVLDNSLSLMGSALLGAELNQSNNPLPSRELQFRGYYDVNSINAAALAYDVLAGYYRQDQGFADGLTVCEDYLIRDMLANWVHWSLLNSACYQDPAWGTTNYGMWETAHKVGGMACAAAMPKYDTKYFGTSGLDGGTTTELDNPFPAQALTWKQVFWDDNAALQGFPNLHYRFGWEEGNFASDPTREWIPRYAYSQQINMGHIACLWGNLRKMFGPGRAAPNLLYALNSSAAGVLTGSPEVGNEGFRAFAGLQNAYYPEFSSVARPAMLARSDGESLGDQLNSGGLFVQLYYDHALQSASTSTLTATTVTAATLSYNP